MQKYLTKSLVKKSLVKSLLLKNASAGGWTGKPSSWPDIRKNLIPNSIRILADERYPLGFTANATGGYKVKIDGEDYNTYASGAQCSIPQTDWPKGHNIYSLTAYGATEQNGTPTPDTPIDIVCNNGVIKYGKDIYNTTLTQGLYTNGEIDSSVSTWVATVGKMSVKNGVVYTLKAQAATSGKTVVSNVMLFKDDAYIGYLPINTPPYNFTPDGTYNKVALQFALDPRESITTSSIENVQLIENDIYTDGTVETIWSHSKNLFDEQWNKNTGTSTSAATWGQVVSATGWSTSNLIPVKEGEKYTTSYSVAVQQYVFYYNADGTMQQDYNNTNAKTYTTTIPSGAVAVRLQCNKAGTDIDNVQVQFESGETATTYEQYYGGTATAEMLLKVGDYQDTQEVITGSVTRNVGIKVLDGTEDWKVGSTGRYFVNVLEYVKGNYTPLSTHFPMIVTDVGSGGLTTINTLGLYVGSQSAYQLYAYPNTTIGSDVNTWKQWLANQYAAGTPVIIVYPLATATTESVTPQALAGTTVEVTAGSISDLQITYTQASAGYPIDYPTGAETAHIVDIYPATEGNNITAFKFQRVADSGSEEQGCLWAHFNIQNQIELTMFGNSVDVMGVGYRNTLIEAVTAKNNKLSVSSLYYAFINLTNLEYIPKFSYTSNFNILLEGAFDRTAITSLAIKDTAISSLVTTCRYCEDLTSVKLLNVDLSGLEHASQFIVNSTKLKDTVFDFSSASSLKEIGIYGDSSNFVSGIKGLRVSSSAPFDNATAPQINVSYTGMDKSALAQLFNDLPYNVGYTVVGSPTINNGILSNITSSDFVQINSSLTITPSTKAKFYCKFKTPNAPSESSLFTVIYGETAYQRIFALYGASNKLYFLGGFGLTSTYEVEPLTYYNGEIEFDGNGNATRKLYDNNNNLLDTVTGEITETYNISKFYIGIPSPCIEEIDLNNTYIEFNNVPWFTGKAAMTKTLSCVGCTGTADLTADDKDIALNKGWSLTLS